VESKGYGGVIPSQQHLGGAKFGNIVSDIIVHPSYKKFSAFQDEYTYDFAMMKFEAVTLPNLVAVVLNADESNAQINQFLTTNIRCATSSYHIL